MDVNTVGKVRRNATIDTYVATIGLSPLRRAGDRLAAYTQYIPRGRDSNKQGDAFLSLSVIVFAQFTTHRIGRLRFMADREMIGGDHAPIHQQHPINKAIFQNGVA
jgi:hypothetical protein